MALNNEPVLINGQAYDFAQIIAKIAGVDINSLSEIEYEEEQKKENNFGKGNRPVSRGSSTIKAKASITMSMNDVEALRLATIAVTGGSLLKIPPFDVTVTYLNVQQVVTHVLKNCEFIKDGTSAKLDDTDIKAKYDLVISHVIYR